MAFETGTASSMVDLLTKLDTFATGAPGWTGGYTSNPDNARGFFELSKGNLSFSCRYDFATPLHLSIHHAEAFVGNSTNPGDHTNDSGNGYNSTSSVANANLLTERCVSDLGNGPFQSYYFFQDTEYIHVAVEAVPGMFRHFGFGLLEKFNPTSSNLEYVYGHRHDDSTSANGISNQHTTLLDSQVSSGVHAGTIRIFGNSLEGMTTERYGITSNATATGNDSGSVARARLMGGYRGGFEARGFAGPVGNSSDGFISFSRIPVYYKDPSNRRWQLLGWQPDVRQFNIRNFTVGQEFTFDSNTWVLLPMSIKSVQTIAYGTEYAGIAYKKVA